MRRYLFALLVIGIMAPLVNGGESTFSCTEQTGVPVWLIPVRTLTRKISGEQNLDATSFSVTAHRIPQQICGFLRSRFPVSIGILVDTSGSMRGRMLDNMAIAILGINQLLDGSGPQDEYFLEHTNAEPVMKARFTTNLAQIRAALRVRAWGRTALIDSIYSALNEMQQARYQTRVLLVVSDGEDNSSTHTLQDLSRAFAELLIPMFLVIPADTQHRGPQVTAEGSRRSELMQLAFETGGYAHVVSTKQEVLAVAAELASAFRNVYMLRVQAPATTDGKLSDIRIQVRGVTPRPVLLYRRTGWSRENAAAPR